MPARSARTASGWKRTVSRGRFFEAVVSEALAKNLCSEHFSVDGTLIESFASAKSFQPQQEQDDRPQDRWCDIKNDALAFGRVNA